jgi:very-short-patch-repair endonuclease
MRPKRATPDWTIAKTAARQHDVISLEQLFGAGLSPSAIQRRVKDGRLHRIHRAVYTPGTPNLTREGYFMAAVLAVKGAVLSHASAAALHSLSPTCPPLVQVTVPGHHGRRRRPGIVIRRSTTLTPAETTLHRGIPVTAVARTLADLGWGTERTCSDLERLFLRICRHHGIAKPEGNVNVGPYTVDFLWRAERLVVEVDGYAYHSSRRSFESDRARDRRLKLRGYEVLRFTDRELSREPDALAASMRAHLRRRVRQLML